MFQKGWNIDSRINQINELVRCETFIIQKLSLHICIEDIRERFKLYVNCCVKWDGKENSIRVCYARDTVFKDPKNLNLKIYRSRKKADSSMECSWTFRYVTNMCSTKKNFQVYMLSGKHDNVIMQTAAGDGWKKCSCVRAIRGAFSIILPSYQMLSAFISHYIHSYTYAHDIRVT